LPLLTLIAEVLGKSCEMHASGLDPRNSFVHFCKASSNGMHHRRTCLFGYLIFKVRLGDEDALSLLESIITAPQVPIVAIRRSANTLISYAISDKAPVQMSTAHRLLTTIKQRHPAAFNKAADALCEEDKDIKASVEQLIISLSVVRRHAVHQPIFLGAYFTVL